MKWEVFHARLNCYKLYSLRDLSQRVYNSKRFKSVFVLFYFHLVDPMPPLPSLMCASRPSRRELNKRLIRVTVAHLTRSEHAGRAVTSRMQDTNGSLPWQPSRAVTSPRDGLPWRDIGGRISQNNQKIDPPKKTEL